jgi:hypothetical protein
MYFSKLFVALDDQLGSIFYCPKVVAAKVQSDNALESTIHFYSIEQGNSLAIQMLD